MRWTSTLISFCLLSVALPATHVSAQWKLRPGYVAGTGGFDSNVNRVSGDTPGVDTQQDARFVLNGGAGIDDIAFLRQLGFDAVDVVAHIDLVDHGVFVGVFGDEVLPKKADGLFGGCGGEANEEGIEVFEHLAPEVVDGAVAFVDDDYIELFDGDVGVVADGPWFFIYCACFHFET